MAGRGFGKTRTGAETVRKWIFEDGEKYVNLIGATADDARDIMIEGESGILNICTNAERPRYIANKNLLIWPTGARSLIFTADRPERLRGKQHGKLWGDELAAWRYAKEAFDQAMLGLRLGKNPQAIFTTTPRPINLVRQLIRDPRTVVTGGTTYDNKQNLAPQFVAEIIKQYEGTRLGRQELNAELLEDNPNALFKRENIDQNRVSRYPNLVRIGVGVDPSVTADENSNETGIVVAGLGEDGHAYVLEDFSLTASPEKWAREAVNAYHKSGANFIVAEVNNGGDLVKFTIKTIDKDVFVMPVHASKGKTKRAEPISSLYEQNKVHHVGTFAKLEDQMCDWDPTIPPDKQVSPDRMDALVWILSKLMLKEPKPFLMG